MRGVVGEGVACPGLLCATSLRTGFRSACFCLSRCGKYSLHSVTIRGVTFHRISTVFRSFAQYFELFIRLGIFEFPCPPHPLRIICACHYPLQIFLPSSSVADPDPYSEAFGIRIRIPNTDQNPHM